MNRGTPDTERFFGALRGALSPVATSEPPAPGLRSAGVLVPLRDSGGEVTVTLSRRTERDTGGFGAPAGAAGTYVSSAGMPNQ